jgi:hypothetical protein
VPIAALTRLLVLATVDPVSGSAPGSSVSVTPNDLEFIHDLEAQLLFEEARRRRRRIRAAVSVAVIASAVVIAAVAVSLALPGPRSAPGAKPVPVANALGSSRTPSLVWVDYRSKVRIGSTAGGTERALATVDASPITPVVVAGGRAYIVDTAGAFVRRLGHWAQFVDAVDLSTGNVRFVAPGDGVFASADGRRLYVAQAGDSSVIVLSTHTGERSGVLTLPHGWYLPGGAGVAVASDIVVQSNDSGTVKAPDAIGLWNPGTGSVRLLAQSNSEYTAASPDLGIIGASTSRSGATGRLAWMPPGCESTASCPIEVTDVPSLRTRTIESPLHFGFAPGGAISSNGRSMVAFALGPPSSTRPAVVALVDLDSGRVRLVRGARLDLGQVAAWATWLPHGGAVIAGDTDRVYEVHVAQGSASPVVFRTKGRVLAGPDFSAGVVGS